MSPGFPIDSICRAKIWLNEKSFPIAVNAEVSVDKEIAGIDLLFFLYFTTNSVAICCASDALPPFPNKIILLPFFRVLITRFKKLLNSSKWFFKKKSILEMCSFISFSNIFLTFNFLIS